MKNIKVSVIVPVYNSEVYLKKCLDSIISQTLKDIEIIVVDNASTDNSAKIIKSYGSKVKYYYLNEKGIGLARNYGIEKAHGEYIVFFDSDDYMRKDMCKKLYNYSKENDLDITCMDYYTVTEDTGKIIETKTYDFDVCSIYDNNELFYKFSYGPQKMFNRRLFNNKKYRFPTDLKYEDLLLVGMFLKDFKRIGKVNENLFYYLVHSNSETTVMDRKVFDVLEIVKRLNKYFGKKNKELMKNFACYQLTTYTIRQRYQASRKVRKEFINKSFKYLDENFEGWKKAKYFKTRPLFKRIIEKSKCLSILYCDLYRFLKH